MRRLGATVAAGAIALLAVACGQQEDVGFGGQPPTSPVTSEPQLPTADPGNPNKPGQPNQPVNPNDPVPPDGTQAVPPAKVDASALPEGYPRIAWTDGDGSTVGAYGVASSGCVQVRGELAEQNAQRVVLRMVEQTTGTGVCTMQISYPPVAVKLAEPLGERTVVLQRTTG